MTGNPTILVLELSLISLAFCFLLLLAIPAAMGFCLTRCRWHYVRDFMQTFRSIWADFRLEFAPFTTVVGIWANSIFIALHHFDFDFDHGVARKFLNYFSFFKFWSISISQPLRLMAINNNKSEIMWAEHVDVDIASADVAVDLGLVIHGDSALKCSPWKGSDD